MTSPNFDTALAEHQAFTLKLVERAMEPRPSLDSRRLTAREDIAERAFDDCQDGISSDLREHLCQHADTIVIEIAAELAKASKLATQTGVPSSAEGIAILIKRMLCNHYARAGFTDEDIDHWMSFQPKPDVDWTENDQRGLDRELGK